MPQTDCLLLYKLQNLYFWYVSFTIQGNLTAKFWIYRMLDNRITLTVYVAMVTKLPWLQNLAKFEPYVYNNA